jgi:hypothetical protein
MVVTLKCLEQAGVDLRVWIRVLVLHYHVYNSSARFTFIN